METEHVRIALHLAQSQEKIERSKGNTHAAFVLSEIVVTLHAALNVIPPSPTSAAPD